MKSPSFWWRNSVLNGFPCGSTGKSTQEEDLGLIPGLGRSLQKGKATHSSILAWRIPWVRHNWATFTGLSISLVPNWHFGEPVCITITSVFTWGLQHHLISFPSRLPLGNPVRDSVSVLYSRTHLTFSVWRGGPSSPCSHRLEFRYNSLFLQWWIFLVISPHCIWIWDKGFQGLPWWLRW